MAPKAKTKSTPKHLGRAASSVHALNASGNVAKNFTVWCDLAPSVRESPKLAFARCLVLPGSSATEYKLKQIDPPGFEDAVFTAPLNRVWNANEETIDPLSIRDIGLLQHQNTAAVLDFLRARFMNNVIYTTADPLLVAINPFKDIKNCTDDIIVRYRDAPDVLRLAPHSFGIARMALDNLHGIGRSQTIIVTGESGAGKTEATKHCMRFFASAKGGIDLRIQNAVMAANPVLEAFGNAKTIRNNNSSRFGRFMQLVVARGGGIVNGKVQGFLLEKVRVVSQQPNERSYHIFYQFLKGASADERKRFRLEAPSSYKNLTERSGGCFDAPGIDDVEEWKDVRRSFVEMQLSDSEVETVLSIVAGVLLLGNVTFLARNIDGQDAAADLDDRNRGILRSACELLYLSNIEKVDEGLRTTVKQIGKEMVTVRVQQQEAMTLKQSLGKAMYDCLFKWIIIKLNRLIEPPEFACFMGMLDIFGFEVFEDNSLEQLLINITNEFLQRNFVDIVFEKESKLYKDEGVSTAELVFTDNAAVIDCLIGKRCSIFAALEDACVAKGSVDKTFYASMCRALKTNACFIQPQGGEPNLIFTVRHTIADIDYRAGGFINKNMDLLKAELAEVAKESPNEVVRAMFRDVVIERGKLGKGQLIASQFLRQLDEMMGIIRSTEPHFIRCVKPNESKKPLDWEADKVLNQLFSLSILEALQLKQLGFSWRRSCDDFVKQFRFLRLDLDDKMRRSTNLEEQKQIARDMLRHLTKCHGKDKFVEGKQWQMGKTMVFMKPETVQQTLIMQRQAMEDYVPSVNLIEAMYRKVLNRRALASTMDKHVRVQSLARRLLAQKGHTVSNSPNTTHGRAGLTYSTIVA